ncbi:MAG: ribonuclease P protein component 4 [Promethearchaeota archaeon]
MAKNKTLLKKIAIIRMNYLFNQAHIIFPENKELANRYAQLAKIYAQRAKLSLPNQWKYRLCNTCKRFLYPGINCRCRIQSRHGKGSHISLTCLECNNTTRYYIKTRRSKKKMRSSSINQTNNNNSRN